MVSNGSYGSSSSTAAAVPCDAAAVGVVVAPVAAAAAAGDGHVHDVWINSRPARYNFMHSLYFFTRTKYKYRRLRRSVAGDPNLHMLAANPYAQMAQQQPTMATLATHVAHLDLGAEVKR